MSLKNFRPKTASVPLSDAIKGFLSAQKDRGAAEKTIIGYQSFLRLLTEGLPPKINVHEITEKEVRKHLAKYEKPASRNAGRVFRCVRPQFASPEDLLRGEGEYAAGGRWNPPGLLRANYGSLTPGTAAEEAYRLFESKGLARAVVGNRVIAPIQYHLQAVWDFSRPPDGLIGEIIREALAEEC